MIKKFVALFGFLVGGSSCNPAYIATPNPYIEQVFTRESAIKTLEEVLNSRDNIFGMGITIAREHVFIDGEVISCTVNPQQFNCQFRYPEGDYNLRIEKERVETIEFKKIREAVCTGEGEAVIYPYSREYFERNPWKINFQNISNCQKFIDALTYLKNH